MHQNYTNIAPSFHGQAKIIKYQLINDELIPIASCIKKNLINRRAVQRLLLSNTTVFDDSRRIALSTDSYTPDYEKVTIDNVIAIGDPALAGVTGYTFAEKTETTPRAGTYHNRFLTPSSQRSFSTIAIVDGTTNNNTSNITSDAYAYLTLGLPVIQDINEVIDIYYKVYLSWANDSLNLNPNFQDELEYLFLAQITSGLLYDENNECVEIQSPNNPDYTLRWRATEGKSNNLTYTQRTAYLKREYSGTATFGSDRLYFGITYGRLERNGSSLEPEKGTVGVIPIKLPSTLGNVFSHSETANTYFYDANTLANSSWQPQITDVEKRSNLFPSVYALRVEASGGIGIGTYSIYRTLYSGGANTNLTSDTRPFPLVVTSKYPYFLDPDNESGFPYNPQWVYPWTDETLWVSANEIGEVGIWRIYPQLELVASWVLPAVTKIRDLATDPNNQYIYVATTEGLFSINAVTSTVTQLSPDSCMAVDVGFSGAVFAAFTDRLASSLNASWADSHSFSGTINWNNVLFVRCDRTSADYNLAILELGFISPDSVGGTYGNQNNQNFALIHWWNNTANYSGVINCQVKTSSSIYWQRYTMFPDNGSFIVKDGIWVYLKYISSVRNQSPSTIRGYNRQLVKTLEARGATIVNSNQELVNTSNQPTPRAFQVGAATFNQEIRCSSYTSDFLKTHYNCRPSFAILNSDISSGYLRVCIAADSAQSRGTTTGYSNSLLRLTSGCFDLSVDPADPTIADYRGYRGLGVNAYYFTHYSSGSGSSQLYYICGNVQAVKGGLLIFSDSSVTNTDYAFSGGNKYINTGFHPLMIAFWGAYNKGGIFNYDSEWSTRYGWNDTTSQWQEDPDNLLPGKPLHTASETAPDGLEIAWSDLQPEDTRDLIANQWYSFTRVPGEIGFVNDGTYGSVPFKFSYYLRPTVNYALNTAIAQTLTLDPASTDPLWLSLDPFEEDVIELTIDGYAEPATILLSGSPGVNEVAISDAQAGILEFNVADVGKNVTGTVLYMQKIHSTEAL